MAGHDDEISNQPAAPEELEQTVSQPPTFGPLHRFEHEACIECGDDADRFYATDDGELVGYCIECAVREFG
jgi:hypothetical protein